MYHLYLIWRAGADLKKFIFFVSFNFFMLLLLHRVPCNLRHVSWYFFFKLTGTANAL